MSNNKHIVRATCFDKRGRAIASGTNSYAKTHPIQASLAKLVGKPDAIYLHAEIAALLACGTRKPWAISVERVRKDGSFGTSKPCPICQRAIKMWGVKNVFYTE